MEQMQERKEKKPTLEELHRVAYGNPKRWGVAFEYGEWSDDDADDFCD